MNRIAVLCLMAMMGLPAADGQDHLPKIAGRVLVRGARTGVTMANVRLTPPDDSAATVRGTVADDEGAFMLAGFPPGTYRLVATAVGFRSADQSPVIVGADADLRIDLELEETEILFSETTVSVARWDEKASAAPVSVSVLTPGDLVLQQSGPPLGQLQGVAGMDVVQKGVMQQDYAARGLNNVFNGTTLTLTDYRMIGLPSLRANLGYLTPVVTEDIDRVEVALGPSSALYGPNATNGVVSIITRSPFSSRGTALSVTGGERSLLHLTGRHAGALADRLAYKVTGQYFRAEDWPQDPAWVPPGTDNVAERWSGEARMTYLAGFDGTLDVAAGISNAMRGIDMTDNGPARADHFRYVYYQGRYAQGKLFAQAYLNRNNAGGTTLLATGMPVVDESMKLVGEVQHGADVGEWQRLIYGGNAYLTRPDTRGTIFGRNEEDDDIDEFGAFVQSETRLVPDRLWLIAALRADWHSMLEEPVFSPRAGLRYSPAEGHTLRATYNLAYATPAPADFFLDLRVTDDLFGIPAYPTALRGVGVPASGYTFERSPDGGYLFRSPFAPDPAMAVPVAGATEFWEAAAGVVTAQAPPETRALLERLFAAVPAPGPGEVRGAMGVLNLETRGFDPIGGGTVPDVPRLEPTINQTIEAGYKGTVSERIRFGVDVYYSRIENFVTSQQVVTPSAFLDGADVAAYLLPFLAADSTLPPGAAEALAQQIGAGMGAVPLGTVVPREARDATDILLAPRNAGDISYWGIDLSASVAAWEGITLSGTYSYMSKTYFEGVTGFGDLSLNAPKHKASAGVRYTAPSGPSGELRCRFVDGFRVRSAVYVGTVASYGLVDAAVSVPLGFVPGTVFTLAATNVLDHRHSEFAGAPEIGRMVTGQLKVGF